MTRFLALLKWRVVFEAAEPQLSALEIILKFGDLEVWKRSSR